MTVRQRLGAAGHEAVPAAFTLPAAGGLLLLVGAVAAVIHPPVAVVVTSCAVVCGAVCLVTPPAGCAAIAVLGWWTATAFSAAPYGELRLGGTASVRGLVSCVGAAVAATGIGILVRRRNAATRRTLDDVDDRRRSGFGGAVPPARVALAIGVAAIALPGLTAALAADRQHLSLTDDLLFFLSLVVAIAVIGGFWPAVVAAVASSLLVNWYFTPPLHTFTIGEPDNLIALLLFVVVAISVSSVVHLA
ncbi:MAG: DUF4118 domain-containing protein, partial [Frankiales bacterium]|nr:DUF4118 domain-containing protein [Frankiales bacterium]